MHAVGVDQPGVWSPTAEKIDRKLARWSILHVSLSGKALLTQSLVGGMTQYLTMVQGMPREIQTRLQKVIHQFMWDGKRAGLINGALASAPKSEGGLNVLDLEAQRTTHEHDDVLFIRGEKAENEREGSEYGAADPRPY